jgi:hypothetical protein
MRTSLSLLLILLAACTVTTSLHAGGRRSRARGQASYAAPRSFDPARDFAGYYDSVLDRAERANQIAPTEAPELAAATYRGVEYYAAQTLSSISQYGHHAVYPTRHDGPIDEPRLRANLEAVRARAGQAAKASWSRFVAIVVKELRVRTGAQRDVIERFGRPDITRMARGTCWSFQPSVTTETFCWSKSGKPFADPRPPLKTFAKYRAGVVFAAGECNLSECGAEGWNAAGTSTTCAVRDCLKNGWGTSYADGTSSRTSCTGSDCATNGWTTEFADGTTFTTRCTAGGCFTNGWTLEGPDGEHNVECQLASCLDNGWRSDAVTCNARFNDVMKNGVDCE